MALGDSEGIDVGDSVVWMTSQGTVVTGTVSQILVGGHHALIRTSAYRVYVAPVSQLSPNNNPPKVPQKQKQPRIRTAKEIAREARG